MKKKIAYICTAFALPLLTFAQTTQVTNVQSAGQFIITLINTVAVPVLFAVAFLVFIFGVFQFFILGRGSEEANDKGKTLMLYGLIGFVVMLCVWGLVNVLVNSVGLNSNVPNYPTAPYSH